jgi:hypothetical protein
MLDPMHSIDGVVAAAARSTAESLRVYWPTYGDTGAHERNLSVHFGAAFLAEGFSVFGEAHSEGDADVRYDLLAFSPKENLLVVAEFKQLWSRGSARAMRHDVERLHDFSPVVRLGSAGTANHFGLMAAFTEHDARYDQLLGSQVARECPETRELLRATHGAPWRRHPICQHGRHPSRPGALDIVYTFFPLARRQPDGA